MAARGSDAMMTGVMIPFHEDGEAEVRGLRQTCLSLVSAVSAFISSIVVP